MRISFDQFSKMCRTALDELQQPLSQSTIHDTVDELHETLKHSLDQELTDQQIKKIETGLRQIFTVEVARERAISFNHVEWLPDLKGALDWKHWDRYRQYLGDKEYGSRVVNQLDKSTDAILGFVGNPKSTEVFDKRGLVVGEVQSGKTSNYIGLVNKAIDAGYKVIVILTGFTESLRMQTQQRADEGVLGYFRDMDTQGHIQTQYCGVDKFGRITPRTTAGTNRMQTSGDFNVNSARTYVNFLDGAPVVFVVKKNYRILSKLLDWLMDLPHGDVISKDGTGRVFFDHRNPLLVIDDESDVGSVDTKKGSITIDEDFDEEEVNLDHMPATINRQTRQLLSLFDQSSYVGYTATPFANVLIHSELEVATAVDSIGAVDGENERLIPIGKDLFPKDFIVNLPTPTSHIGPSKFFNLTSSGDLNLTEEIPREDFKDWMPTKFNKEHVPEYENIEQIPPSLERAIRQFILVCSARCLRGDDKAHNSMLVHVARFVDVQQHVRDQIEDYLTLLQRQVQNNLGDIFNTFEEEWEKFDQETQRVASANEDVLFQNPRHDWKNIKEKIKYVCGKIQIKKVSGPPNEENHLTYDKEVHPNGLWVIAVGGDKLSRGLTLEGLSVSYFLRGSVMYDTLMQMGRWFGYRNGYLDLCRLWLSEELLRNFTLISKAADELREEFNLMESRELTPMQYGLRIRAHDSLRITSPLKSRHTVKVPASFPGQGKQTGYLCRDEKAVLNIDALQSLVATIEQKHKIEKYDMGKGDKKINGWDDVPASAVINFLNNFHTPKEFSTATFPPNYMANFIEDEVKEGRLTHWAIHIVNGECSSEYHLSDDFKINLVNRQWSVHPSLTGIQRQEKINIWCKRNIFRVKQLLDPPSRLVDLTNEERKKALEFAKEVWENNDRRNRSNKRCDEPTVADHFAARNIRCETRALLAFYIIDPSGDGSYQQRSADGKTPLVGVNIEFSKPANNQQSTLRTYQVNSVYQQQELFNDH